MSTCASHGRGVLSGTGTGPGCEDKASGRQAFELHFLRQEIEESDIEASPKESDFLKEVLGRHLDATQNMLQAYCEKIADLILRRSEESVLKQISELSDLKAENQSLRDKLSQLGATSQDMRTESKPLAPPALEAAPLPNSPPPKLAHSEKMLAMDSSAVEEPTRHHSEARAAPLSPVPVPLEDAWGRKPMAIKRAMTLDTSSAMFPSSPRKSRQRTIGDRLARLGEDKLKFSNQKISRISTVLQISEDEAAMGFGETQHKVQKPVFADAAAMKEQLKKSMAKTEYNVADFYDQTSAWGRLAKSRAMENTTLLIIGLNAVWIAVDTDYNKAAILLDADPLFQIAQHMFCLYFTVEILIRFLAFEYKRNCLKDSWFVFDAALVSMMVLETWVLTTILLCVGGSQLSSFGDAGILRIFRLLRLTRMARMARLLRAMPELMVIIKAMSVAMRSVFFALCLLMTIIYVFSIAFAQLMEGTNAGDMYFKTVGDSVQSLLLHATLPDHAAVVLEVGNESFIYYVGILAYILLASLTVMNMLVGILCEVVSVVSAVEKESLLLEFVKGEVRQMMVTCGIDANGDGRISRGEFERLLTNKDAAKALQEVGVDVVGLVDFTDVIFAGGRHLTFADFMETVLSLRGSNVATVKDIVDLRKLLIKGFSHMEERLSDTAELH